MRGAGALWRATSCPCAGAGLAAWAFAGAFCGACAAGLAGALPRISCLAGVGGLLPFGAAIAVPHIATAAIPATSILMIALLSISHLAFLRYFALTQS